MNQQDKIEKTFAITVKVKMGLNAVNAIAF
jgi:hypothetical protein